MAQIKTFSWTNPNPAVARNIDCGFEVAEITVVDTTNGGSWYWANGMASASVLDVDAGTISSSNGVTPLAQNASFGAPISNFTSANPGVITVTGASQYGFTAGDTVQVSALADDGSGTSKNGQFTIASVSGNTITLSENTTGYSVYVSGGYLTRVSDSDGNPVAIDNVAIRGVNLGTSAVGANSAAMVAVAKSSECVV